MIGTFKHVKDMGQLLSLWEWNIRIEVETLIAIAELEHIQGSLIQAKIVFLPEASFGLRVLSLPASVCVPLCVSVFSLCVNQLLLSAITREPFKLGSPNLKHMCKRPWLRSLLFWWVIDLYIQGQIYLQSQNLPRYWFVHAITHHPFKLGPTDLNQRCKILW